MDGFIAINSLTGACSKTCISLLLTLLFLVAGTAVNAEVGGVLTQELNGVSLVYEYTSGRKYSVEYKADTFAYLRMDEAGREWVRGIPYIARKIDENLYLLNWHTPERVEYVTILIDLDRQILYTSALLEGTERHFDVANIVSFTKAD